MQTEGLKALPKGILMLYQKYIYTSDNALILCLLLLFGFSAKVHFTVYSTQSRISQQTHKHTEYELTIYPTGETMPSI